MIVYGLVYFLFVYLLKSLGSSARRSFTNARTKYRWKVFSMFRPFTLFALSSSPLQFIRQCVYSRLSPTVIPASGRSPISLSPSLPCSPLLTVCPLSVAFVHRWNPCSDVVTDVNFQSLRLQEISPNLYGWQSADLCHWKHRDCSLIMTSRGYSKIKNYKTCEYVKFSCMIDVKKCNLTLV